MMKQMMVCGQDDNNDDKQIWQGDLRWRLAARMNNKGMARND